jgi:prepilin-type N-terminal cleavage/methylation domain-containing protein
MKKSAFTMIELVFVIVILGIMASIAMGRMERDLKQEASETILSHIRLAQQLALNDNKHRSDSDSKWQKAYWRFEYGDCSDATNYDGTDSLFYRVGSDINRLGSINKVESAINPNNGKYIYTFHTCDTLQPNETPEVLLSKKFGIRDIDMNTANGCGISIGSSVAKQIAFDYLGRPHRGVGSYNSPSFQKLMIEDCNITFTMSTDYDNNGIDDSFIITIEAETGHAFIVGQENS